MRVVRGYRGLEPQDRGASAALGNFDGVHRGHKALLESARRPGARLGLVCFEPHPRRFFRPEAAPFRLTAPRERARILAGLGLERLYEIPFDAGLAAMSAEDFIARVLAGGPGEGLGLVRVVVGADFRFGHARRGDAEMLRRLGPAHGLEVGIHEMAGGPGGVFSSTAIRQLVAEGRVAEAAEVLGRWHTASGRVIKGDQRGRTLGYPTANLDLGEQIKPRHGVYATRVQVLDGPHRGDHDGVASIGVRPQFGVNAPNFEVHLFDFQGDLYGAEISVALVAFLREEARFDGVDALIAQMDADSREARARLARAAGPA